MTTSCFYPKRLRCEDCELEEAVYKWNTDKLYPVNFPQTVAYVSHVTFPQPVAYVSPVTSPQPFAYVSPEQIPRAVNHTPQVPKAVNYSDYESRFKQALYMGIPAHMERQKHTIPVRNSWNNITVEKKVLNTNNVVLPQDYPPSVTSFGERQRQAPVPFAVKVWEKKQQPLEETFSIPKTTVPKDKEMQYEYETQVRSQCECCEYDDWGPKKKMVEECAPVYDTLPDHGVGIERGNVMTDYSRISEEANGTLNYKEVAFHVGGPSDIKGDNLMSDSKRISRDADGILKYNDIVFHVPGPSEQRIGIV